MGFAAAHEDCEDSVGARVEGEEGEVVAAGGHVEEGEGVAEPGDCVGDLRGLDEFWAIWGTGGAGEGPEGEVVLEGCPEASEGEENCYGQNWCDEDVEG